MGHTRRSFLTNTTAAAAVIPFAGSGISRAKSPNEKLNIASIAVGGRGWADVNGAAKGHNLVAFCDVMTGMTTRKGGYAAAAKQWPKARRYQDWRKLLDESQDIDAITISTPDHMHALPTLAAATLGKHVFTQKPLTHTVHESRTLLLETRRLGVATQMGIQNQSTVGHRTAVAMIQSGLIGKITEAHGWSHKKWAGPTAGRPAHADRIPTGLDWDLWLGVAPIRPYAEKIYQPMNWRGWTDFGSGTLGDMGIHIFEPMVSALNVAPPVSVQSYGMKPNSETWQAANTIKYEFSGNQYTAKDMLEYFWQDGASGRPSILTSEYLPADLKLPNQGTLFVGESGVIVLPHGGKPMVFPDDLLTGYEIPTVEKRSHFESWYEAIRTGNPACASFDFAAPLTETVLLGNIAVRFPNQKLKWDSAALRFTNNDEANLFIKCEYRQGWQLDRP
ncbi:MAG: Gfo/Idh/MocA family oxidoreductase [Fuerstiella sp.]|nr:Gfo/Idh/MocA family oxidoreductase [Fuerstiella sp.]MCP4508990.1 Gfo/Idh/MocA family oxidoreductase [Fuerstiella sp.]MDG2130710.1 Gfo/Idh/MocA family oxidoreductase [Fuerstiella sp.]